MIKYFKLIHLLIDLNGYFEYFLFIFYLLNNLESFQLCTNVRIAIHANVRIVMHFLLVIYLFAYIFYAFCHVFS